MNLAQKTVQIGHHEISDGIYDVHMICTRRDPGSVVCKVLRVKVAADM